MANSTKNTYKPSKKGNYMPVVRMEEGGNVSELNYSERREYIEENYAPFISEAQMIFSIWDSGIEYDYKADRKEVVNKIIEEYNKLGDYTESNLPQETIYEIQDWELIRKEIDAETDEVVGETPLKEISADNTYNFSYKGLVDLNWRVYHDEEYDRFFYVITPHLGGDIRGNYGDAIILEGNDKEELFYRFYEGFISGGAGVYFKFKDGSEIGFDSEQDSDVFNFRVSESLPTGMAQKYLNDFEKFDSWKGDEFLEETIDIYLMRKGIVPKMMAGGTLNDEIPKAYIQILGYDEGKWIDLTDFSDGEDVMAHISDWMDELNNELGGNREEYAVADYEGFGDDLYDEYMGSNEFDEIIEAYEKYKNADFPADVISAYKNDSGRSNDSLSEIIDEMEDNFFGKYENLKDFGYEMVEQGIYEPSENDVFITDIDKRFLAGDESDASIDGMSFDDLLKIAETTNSDYEDEKSELEDKISNIESEINDLNELQKSVDDDSEYEKISEEVEDKEIELNDLEIELNDIDSRYEDKAREEAREVFYDEIYDKLDNDLGSWLEDYGYTSDLSSLSFLSVDYEKIGEEISTDYLIVEFDGDMYFFNNYEKGGRISASKRKPKYAYYIVESSTKKLVSGYSTKAEAIEQRKLLVQQYPSMRFEIYTLANLEAKTNLDVYAKKDYVELSALDKLKKVSVDAYRYGQDKVGQAQVFLERNDVKGRIKRGVRKVYDKTRQGAGWVQNKWREADFGDGTGKATFFADGGVSYSDYSYQGNTFMNGEYKPVYKKENNYFIKYYNPTRYDFLANEDDIKNYNIFKMYSNGGGVDYYELQDLKNQESTLEKRLHQVIDNQIDGWRIDKAEIESELELVRKEIAKIESSKFDDGGVVNDEVFESLYEKYRGKDYFATKSRIETQLRNWKSFVQKGDENAKKYTEQDIINNIEEISKSEAFFTFSKIKEAIENNDKQFLKSRIRYDQKFSKDIFETLTGEKLPSSNTDIAKFLDSKDFNIEKYEVGGMAGLGDVSGMLPNPLPMSTIQPMADGGELQSLQESLLKAEKNYRKAQQSERVGIITETELEKSKQKYESIRTKINDWYASKPISENKFEDGDMVDTDYSHKKHEESETAEEEIAEHKYDVYDNKRMLENQANEIEHHSEELNEQVSKTKKVPAWVIAKMERATTDLSDITHYLDGENKLADGGKVGDVKYEIIPLPSSEKFIIVQVTYLSDKEDENIIRDFNGNPLKFDDINSAQKFIENMDMKYPYGVEKANVGMLLLASQFAQQKQQSQVQSQPQVVYYIPQQQEEIQDEGIVQNIPEMAEGGVLGHDDEEVNDFCITNLIELANDLQSVRYFITDRFKESEFESKKYNGKLIIVFKEPASINVVNSINQFIEKAEDCHHIFEQSVNVSGTEPNSISINLLSEKFSDREFKKGGKVYDYAPKKINLEKTKKITTDLGDYNLGLITDDFVYFVNPQEGDENASTIMYNKKGELLSDNYFASSDLYEKLESGNTFEFIHPDIEAYRQEIINGN